MGIATNRKPARFLPTLSGYVEADPYDFLNSFFNSANIPSLVNISHYSNPTVNKALNKGEYAERIGSHGAVRPSSGSGTQ